MNRLGMLTLAAAISVAALSGCVERTVKIETDPPGAVAVVNDEEVGVTPVKFSFLWYGDYDLILRKPGYETLKTHFRVDAPWYQLPPFDLVAETMIIGTVHDDHVLPPFELTVAEPPPAEELVQRAVEMRAAAGAVR